MRLDLNFVDTDLNFDIVAVDKFGILGCVFDYLKCGDRSDSDY